MDHWIKLFIAQLYLLLAIGVFYRYHVHHDLAKTCVFRWYIAKSELQTINSWRQRHVLSDNKTVDTGANLSFFATKCTFFTRYFPSIQGQMPSLSSELQVFSVSRGRKRISHSSHLISPLLADQIFFFNISWLHLSKTDFFPWVLSSIPLVTVKAKPKAKALCFIGKLEVQANWSCLSSCYSLLDCVGHWNGHFLYLTPSFYRNCRNF